MDSIVRMQAFVDSYVAGLDQSRQQYRSQEDSTEDRAAPRGIQGEAEGRLDVHQIYVRITTGHGTETVVRANDAAKALAGRFSERANRIASAQGIAAGAWQGGASTAAAWATTPLSESFAMAQLAANATALDAVVTAFDHIRSQVEPVPATPPQSSFGNDVNPFQSDTDAAINAYNAKAAKNVALYEAYNADTTAARGQVPKSYAQPAPLNASASAVTRTASPIGPTSAATPQVGLGRRESARGHGRERGAGREPGRPTVARWRCG